MHLPAVLKLSELRHFGPFALFLSSSSTFSNSFQHHRCSPALTCSASAYENHVNIISIWLIIDQCQGNFPCSPVCYSPTQAAQRGHSPYLLSCVCDLVLEHSYLRFPNHALHRSVVCTQLQGICGVQRIFPRRNSIKCMDCTVQFDFTRAVCVPLRAAWQEDWFLSGFCCSNTL